MKTYKGRYKPINPAKYAGDPDKCVYRSMWERHVMKWCDNNTNVAQWVSEECVIPYICDTDKRPHRYFTDFLIKYKDGRVVIVEVKPFKETQKPVGGRGKTRQRVLTEGLTYIKNQSKWIAAKKYAADRGWHFEIWTEKELTKWGIMPKPLKKLTTKKPIKAMPSFKAKAKKKR
jgi:hypothetical protein|tara:strand:+ start:29914 stop:30435 length:522 start_codon:yes stop_codon:yes gene_type:complete